MSRIRIIILAVIGVGALGLIQAWWWAPPPLQQPARAPSGAEAEPDTAAAGQGTGGLATPQEDPAVASTAAGPGSTDDPAAAVAPDPAALPGGSADGTASSSATDAGEPAREVASATATDAASATAQADVPDERSPRQEAASGRGPAGDPDLGAGTEAAQEPDADEQDAAVIVDQPRRRLPARAASRLLRSGAPRPVQDATWELRWNEYTSTVRVQDGQAEIITRHAETGQELVRYRAAAQRDENGDILLDGRGADLEGPWAHHWSPDSFRIGADGTVESYDDIDQPGSGAAMPAGDA
ncbi:MAG: hypothetical protein ACOCXJ_05275 [Planctomycetota bacterium]